MTHEEVQSVVHATLAVLGRVAERTRSPADNMLVAIWQGSEEKLVKAVTELVRDSAQPLTPERVTAALTAAGIRA